MGEPILGDLKEFIVESIQTTQLSKSAGFPDYFLESLKYGAMNIFYCQLAASREVSIQEHAHTTARYIVCLGNSANHGSFNAGAGHMK